MRPGGGLLVRRAGFVFLLTDAEAPAAADLAAAVTGSSGADLVERSFDVVRKRRPEPVPAFCILVEDGAEVQVAIHGKLTLEVDAAGGRRKFAGATATSRVEETLDSSPGWAAVGSRKPRLAGEDFLDMVEGIASAGGFELAGRGAEAEAEPATIAFEPVAATAGAAAAPTDGAAAAAESTIIDKPPPSISGPPPGPDLKQALTMAYQSMGSAPEHVATPDVEGRLCGMGHLNNPKSKECWICGSPVGAEKAAGPRPPLGRISSSDKQSWIVDGDLVLGRHPDVADAVKAGRARAIQIPPDRPGVSRLHAAIELAGWSVRVRDLGSANGTYVFPPGESEWRRVDPAHPLELVAGTYVALGDYELYFEAV